MPASVQILNLHTVLAKRCYDSHTHTHTHTHKLIIVDAFLLEKGHLAPLLDPQVQVADTPRRRIRVILYDSDISVQCVNDSLKSIINTR
jgi:hypothetical protein